MSKPKQDTSRGQIGFWMRVDKGANVRVVNGRMYKLLNAKSADTLTAIYSLFLIRAVLMSLALRSGSLTIRGVASILWATDYGLIGLKGSVSGLDWENNTTYPLLTPSRERAAMLRSTYLSNRRLRQAGLKVGSASGTANRSQSYPTDAPTRSH